MNKFSHIFRLGWAYKITNATELSYPPYQYTIEATNICNLKCTFCPQSDPEHLKRRPRGKLSEENLKIFLDKRAGVGPGNRNINFTLDGEPLINKDFVRFIEIAASYNLFSIFASNGTLINRETADRLARAGPFRASIDFASDKKIFETIRGKDGHYDKVLENLRYLIESARENNNVHLDINDITHFSGVDSNDSLKQMRTLFPDNISPHIRFNSRHFHNFCGHLDMKNRDENYRLCPYPWTQMAITYSGDCVPCCRDTAARSILGNVFNEDIMTIWNGEKYRQFRQNLIGRHPDKNDACRNCDLPYSGGQPRWRPGYLYRSLIKR